jgi:large subunit ribosomal protein L35
MSKLKMKTKKSALKRFKVTATGKVLRHRAYHSHLLRKKNANRKRRLRKVTLLSGASKKAIKGLLPYEF